MSRVFARLLSAVGLLVLGALLLLAEGCLSPAPRPPLSPQVALPTARIAKQILAGVDAALAEHPQSREVWLLKRFYVAHAGYPSWINRQGLSPAVGQLLNVLEKSGREGFSPRRYDLNRLRRLLQPPADKTQAFLGWSPQQVARIDIALSRVFFRYAGDNLRGQERSWKSRGDWHRRPRNVDPAQLLDLAFELDAMPSALRELAPPHNGYRQLRRMLQRYRDLAALGGWPQIEEGETLHPGESDPRVPQLRRRLLLEGDLGVDVGRGDVFSFELQQGLRRFQQRHGLAPDATLGPQTLQALNTSVEQRIDQILRNMERWRWEGGRSKGEEIQINLAAFSLEVRDGEQLQLQMPVVIGRKQRSTPLFASRLESLVVSPYWYVPPTLLREALPRIVDDPSYLRRNHYEVLDAQGELLHIGNQFSRKWQRGEVKASLRQQPGPWNPMGQIKFLLPNPWSIYLHDTPQKQLFDRTRRAYSSGCIRLSQPQELARWLLARNDRSDLQLETLLASGGSRMIRLEEPVALKIGYWTAWVDDAGRMDFRDDIYGRDRILARELRQKPPRHAGVLALAVNNK